MVASDTIELRRRMIATCREMNSCGVNQGTSGNLSVRCRDGILITPSSLPYDTMEPEDLVLLTGPGEYKGDRRPSSEWRFHWDILAKRPDAGAVLHCHSVSATALAVHHRHIPAFHYMVAVAGGKDIRCAPYRLFGTKELSEVALEALEGRMACLLGQHGQIALGETLEKALWLAVEVETLAKMYIQALAIGTPPVLSDTEIDRVLDQIKGTGYGQS